jgi:protein-tyrosine phosphatase
MSESYERRLALVGADNFRDLGGYPAAGGRRSRWRRLFRADSLSDLTPADLKQIAELGLRGIVDFGTEDERTLKPNRLPDAACTRVLELGLLACRYAGDAGGSAYGLNRNTGVGAESRKSVPQIRC